jgi:hypothetical protein
MRKIFLLIITFSFSFCSLAQYARKQRRQEKREYINQLIKQEEEGVIAFKKSFVFGAKLISDGYGIFFELGRANSVKKGTLYQLEISERKNIKEEKTYSYYSNSAPSNFPPFIYGKENFFYPVKLGVQQQRLLGNKSNKNGVAITTNYGGGVSLAFLRPYYIQVSEGNSVMLRYIKYNSSDSAEFLGSHIIGGPTFGKGWNELTVSPGLYAKAAVRFDYGSYNEVISAIEVGVAADLYSKKIPQIVYSPEKQFFFSGYVTILFGKRK